MQIVICWQIYVIIYTLVKIKEKIFQCIWNMEITENFTFSNTQQFHL